MRRLETATGGNKRESALRIQTTGSIRHHSTLHLKGTVSYRDLILEVKTVEVIVDGKLQLARTNEVEVNSSGPRQNYEHRKNEQGFSPNRQRIIEWLTTPPQDRVPETQRGLAKELGYTDSRMSSLIKAIKKAVAKNKVALPTGLSRQNYVSPADLVSHGDSIVLQNWEPLAEKIVAMANKGNQKAIEWCLNIADKYRNQKAHSHVTNNIVVTKGATLVNLEMRRMYAQGEELQQIEAQIAQLQSPPPKPVIEVPPSKGEQN